MHGRSPDPLLQAFALQLLHDDERMAIVVFHFVDRANAGMVQQGSGARLALKALQRLAIPGEVVRKKFDGNVAAQACVFCLIHYAHAPAAQLANNLVVRHDLANQCGLASRSLAGGGLAGHKMPSRGQYSPQAAMLGSRMSRGNYIPNKRAKRGREGPTKCEGSASARKATAGHVRSASIMKYGYDAS